MAKPNITMTVQSNFFLFLLSLSFLNVLSTDTNRAEDALNPQTKQNPFSPKASLIRYWDTHITNTLPKPQFLISKASPLTAVDSVKLTKLASLDSLPSHLTAFCSLANLFCPPSSDPARPESATADADFALYTSKSFGNYGESRVGGADSFKNYSDGLNAINDSFEKYTRGSRGRTEGFASYAREGNVAETNFTSYGSRAVAGSGEFESYHDRVNVPGLRFTSYDSASQGHKLTFSSYAGETNSGSESFGSYSKGADSAPNEFTSYTENANTIDSGFTSYGESGKSGNDSFTSYGDRGNNPKNIFKSYGNNANAGTDSFASYRDGGNVGVDSFQAYSRNSNSGKASFANYGNTFNRGNSTFKDYGKGSRGNTSVSFKTYRMERSFSGYNTKANGVVFARYINETERDKNSEGGGISVNRWVEPGKFFRESELKEGNVMVMPDIKDKMPKRSFLPRGMLAKLPFSSSRIGQLKEIFHAREGSAMERVITDALQECERTPSPGETKRCVGSVEDMIDFATLVLGRNVTVRTTRNVYGSGRTVVTGSVRGINGGDVTKSVSCHQSLYPYLLYYCHSVPRVRVYEVEILDPESRAEINRGVAICHIDTSSWGPEHGAFVALGSGPGRIEVCHWIFENDMTWSVAD